MNLFEMILSNIEPIRLKTGYYVRKRLLHKGYEILLKNNINNQFIHVQYIDNLN